MARRDEEHFKVHRCMRSDEWWNGDVGIDKRSESELSIIYEPRRNWLLHSETFRVFCHKLHRMRRRCIRKELLQLLTTRSFDRSRSNSHEFDDEHELRNRFRVEVSSSRGE